MSKVRAFGKENMDALPQDLIGGLFIFGNLVDLIKCLHFDKDFPENKNIKLKEKGKKTCQVYGGRKWKDISFESASKMMIVQACDIFLDYAEANTERIKEDDINESEYEDLIERLQGIRSWSDEEDIKQVQDDLLRLLDQKKI